MQIVITVIRWFVGLLFIFSGLVKANDPLGLSYKMQEFFEAWGLHSLHQLTLTASISMNVLEVVVGIALIIGWQKKITNLVLILLIAFFTFLTYYVLYSGKIKACGCFGDCIPLTPYQTFTKDIILFIVSIFLLFNLKYQKQIFKPAIGTLVIICSVVLTIGLQLYVLANLPFADCLPYKKGNNLEEQMKPPKGSVPDSIVTLSIYNTNGKTVEIIGDNFPDNFDSTYILEKREDKIVRQGNAEPKIKDFTLFTMQGTDTTNAILSTQQYVLIVVNKLEDTQTMEKQLPKNVINNFFKLKIPVFIVSSTPTIKDYLKLENVNYLIGDATVLKTAARVNTTYFLMNRATVVNKLSFNKASSLLN